MEAQNKNFTQARLCEAEPHLPESHDHRGLAGILITASLINRTNSFSFRVIESDIFKRNLETKKTDTFLL